MLEAAGSGAGSRDTPGRPNITRVLIGAVETAKVAGDDAVLLETNVDDLDPRLWPGVLQHLLAAGAADAWLVPIVMKKGRPAHTLAALSRPELAPALREVMLTRTSTLGVRQTPVSRTMLPRGWVDVTVGSLRIPVKVGHRDGVISQVTPEFDAVERAAAEAGTDPIQVLADSRRAAAELGLVPGARLDRARVPLHSVQGSDADPGTDTAVE